MAVVVVAAALALARWVVPRALHFVAASRGRDLFVLAVVLVGAGITWMASLAGFSLALGAFLAGMVLADSEYGHQALSDSLALRDLFTSLFFVSIGMLLDLRTGFDQPAMVAGVVVAVLLGKAAIAAFAGLVLRFPVRIALLAGFGVAQIGEFSFVLGRQGADLGLLTAGELRVFFAASVVTMFIAPLALRFGPGLAAGASRLGGLHRLDSATSGALAMPAGQPDPQVVILGYGVGGELLAEVLTRGGDAVCRPRSQRAASAPGEAAGNAVVLRRCDEPRNPRARGRGERQAGGGGGERPAGHAARCPGGSRGRSEGGHHRPGPVCRRNAGAARGRRRRGRGPGTRGLVHDHRARDAGSAAAEAGPRRRRPPGATPERP